VRLNASSSASVTVVERVGVAGSDEDIFETGSGTMRRTEKLKREGQRRRIATDISVVA
jgi:hypothetical protein